MATEVRKQLFWNLVEHGYLDRTTKALGVYVIADPSL
jgi:hypothetical protein